MIRIQTGQLRRISGDFAEYVSETEQFRERLSYTSEKIGQQACTEAIVRRLKELCSELNELESVLSQMGESLDEVCTAVERAEERITENYEGEQWGKGKTVIMPTRIEFNQYLGQIARIEL